MADSVNLAVRGLSLETDSHDAHVAMHQQLATLWGIQPGAYQYASKGTIEEDLAAVKDVLDQFRMDMEYVFNKLEAATAKIAEKMKENK